MTFEQTSSPGSILIQSSLQDLPKSIFFQVTSSFKLTNYELLMNIFRLVKDNVNDVDTSIEILIPVFDRRLQVLDEMVL